MKISSISSSLLGIAACVIPGVLGDTYTDPDTGISYYTTAISTTETTGGMTLGFAFPPEALTTNTYDYLGYIVGALTDGDGWSGISHGGSMPNALLMMGWPYNDEVLTSFRYATGYVAPDLYTGNATLSQIASSVNDTHWTLQYLCSNCLEWDQNGNTGSQSTTTGVFLVGWCQALELPTDPETASGATVTTEHDNGEDIIVVEIASATFSEYSSWATMTQTATTTTAVTTTTSATTTATYSSNPVPTTTYDYVIVGAGAGGIPLADSLSAAGKSVLLIERGPPSSGRWGGTMKPDWLDGTNLTRFDVPGLCNQIWHDSAGIACADTPSMAGCVLGGGTAVNAGLWWKPNPIDWDYNFPTGWQSSDMAAYSSSVFTRVPGTDVPSMDGKLYYQQGFEVIASGLEEAGWTDLEPINNSPGLKNKTYGHTEYMFINGERGGPMATYLVTANARSNFKLWMNTTVSRLTRQAGHVTGIEVEAYGDGGYTGTINVTSSGRVILSAGVFGTSKILFRSGIGLEPELETVQSSATDGATMIDEDYWILLPVGENLDDHTNTDTVISHPNVTFYDFYAAYTDPIESDAEAYLNSRSGILAQAAPNIGPMFWDEITGSDGITRQLEWTARVEGSDGAADGTTMTMSQYLGRGSTSRGKLSIQGDLTTSIETLPYLQTQEDIDAVIQGIENLQAALSGVPNLTWIYPAEGESAEDYVNDYAVTVSSRTANHWIGTAKMGTDDGRSGGTAVVDTNTKVYGTDNLFVVDASIIPGMVSTNPSAYIVTISQKAAANILALSIPSPAAAYAQCGGLSWTGTSTCATGYTCTYQNDYYFQCT